MRSFENIPKGGNLSSGGIPCGMACGFQSTISPAKKILVAYYCSSGEPLRFLRNIFAETDGDFFRVMPKHAYPDEYGERMRRYLHEIKTGLLTKICNPPEGIGLYEEIYLLCPACLGFTPPPLRSFLCMCDFSGKTLRMFCLCPPEHPDEFAASACALCPGATVEIFCARGDGTASDCPFSMRGGC